jgi:hypothetical protein
MLCCISFEHYPFRGFGEVLVAVKHAVAEAAE